MKCECDFSLEFENPDQASRILESVKLDNGEWISARLEGRKIICHASSDSVGGLLHTAEDFLACVSLAERMTKKG